MKFEKRSGGGEETPAPAPEEKPWSWSYSSPRAVSITTGTREDAARISRSTENPSPSGIITSSSTRSICSL